MISTVEEMRLLLGFRIVAVGLGGVARLTISLAVEKSGLTPNVDPRLSAALRAEVSVDPRDFRPRPLGTFTGNWLIKSQLSNCLASIVN